MIKIENLSYKYENSQRYSIENINLNVKKGEFIVLTGESGCGKTTLTRVLNGLCPMFYAGDLTGRYSLNGKSALELNLSEIGLAMGNVFQDPRSQFYTRNTTDEILTSMEHRNFEKNLMKERLEEICELLELNSLCGRDIFGLSSGEKQKIAIASACVTKPEILVLDEPSANLDLKGIKQLQNALEILKKQGVTIIISEHRLHYLRDLQDKMIILKDGEIERVYTKSETLKLTSKDLIDMGLRLIDIPHEIKAKELHEAKNAIKIQNINFSYGKKRVLENFSTEIPRGKITVISGENGAGKTTLCKMICGILKTKSGTIEILENNVTNKKRIKQSFFIGQDADYQLFAPTVLEELLINLKNSDYIKTQAENTLENLNLYEYKNRHPVSLSGGQKQRVLLGVAMLRKRKILILDEPTSGLDGKHMRIIAELLKEVSKIYGITVIVITHDLEFANIIADNVLFLDKKDK